MSKEIGGLIALGLVLAAGVGGALGAVSLEEPDLATAILTFAGGLLGGLMMPQVALGGTQSPGGGKR